jgi:hypothetical protein
MAGAREPTTTSGLILVPVTPGELLDRITILRIRSERVTSARQRTLARAALVRANRAWSGARIDGASVADLAQELSSINQRLWQTEDRVREYKRRQEFGAGFVAAAQEIMRLNDRRAALKRKVSARCGLTAADDVKIYKRRSSR